MHTPVLLLIFNRPETTRKVFESIRKAQPPALFVFSDGPRRGRPDDVANCAKTRDIISEVDWPCDVQRLFYEENLGCGRGPFTGISWFFDHVDEGIILEDDCVAVPAFFGFCSTLLEYYRHDSRVMEIGGINLISDLTSRDEYSYHFSDHNHTWGWATWKRAWNLFDYTIRRYPEPDVQAFLRSSFNSLIEYEYYHRIFNETFVHHETVNWWDYQWEFSRRVNLGLSVVPRENLVVNIGSGADATHTFELRKWNMKPGTVSLPLAHPPYVMVDRNRDHRYFQRAFTTLPSRMKQHISRLLPDFASKRRPVPSVLLHEPPDQLYV